MPDIASIPRALQALLAWYTYFVGRENCQRTSSVKAKLELHANSELRAATARFSMQSSFTDLEGIE